MKLIVFLSTGRCGTQFFATYLGAAAGERAVVVHEPIWAQYAPKRTLRAPDLDRLLERYPAVANHFEEIARVLETGRAYVETGWPLFSWIPLLLKRFREDVIVVHLTRDPVRFAMSLAARGYFSDEEPSSAHFHLAALHPTDAGVKHRRYAARWESLNPIERSLFQWLEINAWGEELKAIHSERFLTLRAEDALTEPELLLQRLIEREPSLADVFRERPQHPGIVDRWPRTLDVGLESLSCSAEVIELAERYGYSMHAEDDASSAGAEPGNARVPKLRSVV